MKPKNSIRRGKPWKKWYAGIKPRVRNVLLLQIDLQKHSSWLRDGSLPDKINAKKKLAENFELCIRRHGFAELFWAGDGGVYVAEMESSADSVIRAAYKLFDVFCGWQLDYKDLNCAKLKIRLSAHLAAVYVHPESKYWTGEDLNTFIKNERDIGVADFIAVTEKVLQQLTDKTRRGKGFPTVGNPHSTLRVTDSLNNPSDWRIYYARPGKKRLIPDKNGGRSLVEWIKAFTPFPVANDITIGPKAGVCAHFGGATILQAVQSPSDRLVISLKKQNSVSAYSLTPEDADKVNTIANEFRQESDRNEVPDLIKLCPTEVLPAMSDYPVCEIIYQEEPYSFCRGFHEFLFKNQGSRVRLASTAANRKRNIPGILVTHIAVITASESNRKLGKSCQHLIACQIPDNYRSYYRSTWGVSIGEQVVPGESIEECVRRGIVEEFNTSTGLLIYPVATIIENPILNLGIICIAKVNVTYSELFEKWKTAQDKAENSQIIGIPLDDEVLRSCIKEDKISTKAIEKCLSHDRLSSINQWDLHPTSSIRIASALWFEAENK